MDDMFQIPRCSTIGDALWTGLCSRCCLSKSEKGKRRKEGERKKKLFQPVRDSVHQLSCVFCVTYNREHAHSQSHRVLVYMSAPCLLRITAGHFKLLFPFRCVF